MDSSRDIKNRARRDLHTRMAIPAYYLLLPESDPVPITVRVHSRMRPLGQVDGRDPYYGQSQEIIPRLIFLLDELALPARGAIVSVEAGEAYTIDNVLKPDGITITAEVTEMSADDAAGLPVPA